jgi:hypothetical protein
VLDLVHVLTLKVGRVDERGLTPAALMLNGDAVRIHSFDSKVLRLNKSQQLEAVRYAQARSLIVGRRGFGEKDISVNWQRQLVPGLPFRSR